MRTPPIAKGGFLLSEHDDPNPADPLDRAMPDMTAPGRDPLAGSPTGGAADVSRHPAAIRHQRSHLQSARGPFCHGLPGAAQDELSARCDQPRSASHAGSWCGPVLSFQPEQARGAGPGTDGELRHPARTFPPRKGSPRQAPGRKARPCDDQGCPRRTHWSRDHSRGNTGRAGGDDLLQTR